MMPEFRVITASRTTDAATQHGFVVERRSAGECTRAASKLFVSEVEAEAESERLASVERGTVRVRHRRNRG